MKSRGLREAIDASALPDGSYAVAGRAFAVRGGDLGRQFLPAAPIVSVHVPKAAGTSFRTALEQAFGSRLVLDYGDFPLSSDYETRAQTASARPGVFVPDTAAAVHGHVLASKYRAASPRLAVWVRDPVQRAASHYHFWRDNAGDDDPNHTKRRFLESGLDLAGFAEMPEMRDVHARFLDGVPLSAFAFVGLVEQFARGLRLFARVFDLPAAPPPVVLNVRPAHAAPGHDVPADLTRHITGLTAARTWRSTPRPASSSTRCAASTAWTEAVRASAASRVDVAEARELVAGRLGQASARLRIGGAAAGAAQPRHPVVQRLAVVGARAAARRPARRATRPGPPRGRRALLRPCACRR